MFKSQIIFSDYSKTPFLVRSTSLITEIMLQTSTRQGLLYRKYKSKLTRSINAENAVRQASRANVSEGVDHNFFQIVNSNPNPLEVRFVAYELFSEFIYTLYFWLSLFNSSYYFKYYFVQIGQITFIYFINSVFFIFIKIRSN